MNYEKNIKILNDFEKVLGNGQPVNFQIKNSDGELVKVSKDEFAKWMEEGKNVKTPPKESLVYGVSGDIDGSTYFMERKGKDGFIRESYYQPRSEEEKKQIIERNRKIREQENFQEGIDYTAEKNEKTTNLPSSDKHEQQQVEKESNSQNKSQTDNRGDNKNIYYGIGVISLTLLVISTIIVWVKKKK